MELILWRHAEAEDANPGGDSARALTKRGRKQAERVAAWLRPRLEGDWKILASPAVRAVQTVTPLDLPYEARPALDTDGRADGLLREAGWPDDGRVLIVGHQPTLGEVAAILLGGDDGGVAVRKGAIWWFATRERDGKIETVLKAVMNPEMLESAQKGRE
jgi:phosphohistidine phosphatase